MLRLKIENTCIEIRTREPKELFESLNSDFSRRYLPPLSIGDCSNIAAVIYWISGEEFTVLSASYSSNAPDIYVVSGDYPRAYENESPVFFLTQVLARSLAKEGYIMLTDSVSMEFSEKNVLVLGFPHTGKSTLSSIALSHGYRIYSTENTVVKLVDEVLHVVTGTRVLVFDPRVRDLYDVKVQSTSRTRHGYEVVDLDKYFNKELLNRKIPIDEIYVIYTSFSSSGVSIAPVKGRKVEKLIWYFATGLLKGLDYYYPQPLDMPLDDKVLLTIRKFMETTRKKYGDKFYEVFGSPMEVFRAISRIN
ncbi:MAG: hypothetical protein QXS24_01740 [Desulfurococcaceae archaeon]